MPCPHPLMSASGTATCLACGAEPEPNLAAFVTDALATIDAPPSLVTTPATTYGGEIGPLYDWNEAPFDEVEDLRLMDAEACRRSLAEFCKLAWLVLHPGEPLDWSWHHDALCDHLQWMLEGWMERKRGTGKHGKRAKTKAPLRLGISLCPSSLKTELLMVFMPAWMWVRWPSWRVLCLSCNPRVALDSATLSRRVIESAWYQDTFRPTWRLRDDQNAKSYFGTTEGGARQSHGMAAATVGEHADCLAVDDPVNPMDVSAAELERVNNDWINSIQNRVTDERTAIRVIIHQRLDVDDLLGRLAREGGWTMISIPMEFVRARECATDMPCRVPTFAERKVAEEAGGHAGNRYAPQPGAASVRWRDPREHDGDLMQPERFPPEVIARLKVAPYRWASQYQQDPSPREGGKIKRRWFGWYKLEGKSFGDAPRPAGCVGGPDWRETTGVPPAIEIKRKRLGSGWDFDKVVVSVDAANQLTTDGSLWGITVWGLKGERAHLLADSSRLGDPDAIEELLVQVAIEWRPQEILVEPKAAGPTLVLRLQKRFAAGVKGPDGKSVRCEVKSLPMRGGDKFQRLMGVQSVFAQGLVLVPEGAAWVVEYVDEITMFPNAPKDDRVDSTSQLLAWASENAGVSSLYTMTAEQAAKVLARC